IASPGPSGWAVGNPIEPRPGPLLRPHGSESDEHSARQMEDDELRRADLVHTVGHDHLDPLRRPAVPGQADRTVRMLRDFAPRPAEDTGIRDPWYGDESDFELAWEQIDEATDGILDHVREALGEAGGPARQDRAGERS